MAATAGPDPRRWKALALVCAAFFMTVLDVSIVNVALPSIGTALHFSRESLQWVITAYAITFGGFLLLGGRAADLLGRRRVFMTGVAVFTIASLLCGLAWSEGVLTGEEWLLPLDEVLPHERGQERCDLIPLSERLNGLPMEDFPFDRAALEHRPLQGVEPVEASSDQGLEVRGHDELVFRLARHGEHLGEEEWIAAGGPSNPLAKRSRQSLGQKRVRIVVR